MMEEDMTHDHVKNLSPFQYDSIFDMAERVSVATVTLAEFGGNMMRIARELRYLMRFLRLCDSSDDTLLARKYFEFTELCDMLAEQE